MHNGSTRTLIPAMALMAGLLAAVSAFAGDIAVVAHKDAAVESLTQDELKDIYLGDRTTWNNGQPIVFVILEEGAIHEQFMKDYVKKTGSGFIRYWKKMSMTGKGRMPRGFASEAEALAFVSRTAGAIGYISAGSADANVRIIPIR